MIGRIIAVVVYFTLGAMVVWGASVLYEEAVEFQNEEALKRRNRAVLLVKEEWFMEQCIPQYLTRECEEFLLRGVEK